MRTCVDSWEEDLRVMQRCVDVLNEFCSRWGVVLNQSKCKSMVVSKRKVFKELMREKGLVFKGRVRDEGVEEHVAVENVRQYK